MRRAAGSSRGVRRIAGTGRFVCALCYGTLLACGGQGLPAMAVLMCAFTIMQAVLYCDCLARVIPTELAAVLACCGTILCLAEGGAPLLLARAPLAALVAGFLLACNLASRLRGQEDAFGGGDLKAMPALALFGGMPAFLDGVLACSLFTACAGLVLALGRRKLRGVHVPLAPGMLVCLAATTLEA